MRHSMTYAALALAITARAQPVLPANPTITSAPAEPNLDAKAQPADLAITKGPSDAELYRRQNGADFVGYSLSGTTYVSMTCPDSLIFLTNSYYALCGTAGQTSVPTGCRSGSTVLYSATSRTCSKGYSCNPDYFYDSTDDKSAKAMYGCGTLAGRSIYRTVSTSKSVVTTTNGGTTTQIRSISGTTTSSAPTTTSVVTSTSSAPPPPPSSSSEKKESAPTTSSRKEEPSAEPTTSQPKTSAAPNPETTERAPEPTTTKEAKTSDPGAGSSLAPVETINVTQTRTVTSTASSTANPGSDMGDKSGSDTDSSSNSNNTTTTTATNGGDNNDKKDQAWIAGPVVGGVGGIAAVAALFFVIRLLRKRSAQEDERATSIEASMREKPTDHSPVSPVYPISSASPNQTIRSSELPAYRQASPPVEMHQPVHSAELSGYSSPQQSRVQSAELPAFMVPPQPPPPVVSAELPAYRLPSPPVELHGASPGGGPQYSPYRPGNWQSPDDIARH